MCTSFLSFLSLPSVEKIKKKSKKKVRNLKSEAHRKKIRQRGKKLTSPILSRGLASYSFLEMRSGPILVCCYCCFSCATKITHFFFFFSNNQKTTGSPSVRPSVRCSTPPPAPRHATYTQGGFLAPFYCPPCALVFLCSNRLDVERRFLAGGKRRGSVM